MATDYFSDFESSFSDAFGGAFGWTVGEAAGIGTIFATIFAIFAAFWLVALVIALALYILKSIPICILSKKAGRKHSWLAFVPILGRGYTLAMIGEGPVKIPLIKKPIQKRSTAFWISVLIAIIPGVFSFILAVLALFPYIGPILSGIALPIDILLGLAVAFIGALFDYAFYYDIFKLYQPESTSNVIFAVICILCPFVGLDILATIFLYTLIRKKPVFNRNDQEAVVVPG